MSIFKSEKGKQEILNYYQGLLDKWPVKHTCRFIDTGLCKTHVIDSGTEHKKTVLLLHGSASNSATWMGDVRQWSESFRTVAVDLPGEPGLSEVKRFSLKGDDIAEWLSALVKQLGTEQVGVIGMSLGGFYALKFATAYPELITRLTLIAPAGLAAQRSSFIWKSLFYMLSGKKGMEKINRLVYHNTVVPPEVHEFGAMVFHHFNPVMEPIPVVSDQEIKQLTVPVQYFGGTKDALLNTRKSATRLSRLLPHAQVHLLEDTGHVIIDQGKKIKVFHEE